MTHKTIAQQNDEFRYRLQIPHFGIPEIKGKYLLTQGITAMPSVDQVVIMAKVRDFNEFTKDNDPYNEHDFGKITHNLKDIFWKIDYYDCNYEYHSEDPADPDKTRRVLTVMLVAEY